MKPTAPKLSAVAFALWAASQLANAQITTTPSNLANFTTTVGSASTAQALSINATGPLGAIVVTAPTGFEISTNASTGFAPSITLGIPGGRVQSVYRRSFATHTGSVWQNGSGSEFPNEDAYAAISSNGAVVTWGDSSDGGNPENAILNLLSSNVTTIYSNLEAFAALKTNGSVVTWGNLSSGGNSSVVNALTIDGNWTVLEGQSVASLLSSNVTAIRSAAYAFAALKDNGSVVTWGRVINGGNATAVLKNEINQSWILTEQPDVGSVLSSNVTALHSNWGAFAALKNNGSVVTWGEYNKGGNSSVTQDFQSGDNWSTSEIKFMNSSLNSGVKAIYSNSWAFAALKNDGSVVTWGDLESGGNSTVTNAFEVTGNWTVTEGESVLPRLASNISTIYSNAWAFAALKNDGSVVTWGALYSGGNSSVVAFYDRISNDIVIEGADVSNLLSSNVTTIYSNESAFAALKDNGSVVTWGDMSYGGNPFVFISEYNNGNQTITQGASVVSNLTSGVVAIYSNAKAFAALKENGSVVTWGDAFYGGNSTVTSMIASGDSANYNSTITEIPIVADSLASNVTAVYSNSKAFAALKKDGSVVAWGAVSCGGNLTQYNSDNSTEGASVADQLSSGVIEIYSTRNTFSALKNDGSVVYWGDVWTNLPPNIGASTTGLPAQIYVRLASTGNAQTVNGDLVFSGLTNTDDTGVEIDSLTLSGNIEPATPAITTPPTASAINYGQTLANATLSAGAASVGGSFAFALPNSQPAAGNSTHTVVFTPNDTINYTTTTTSVPVIVNKATPVLTWGTPSSITTGTVLSSNQLNATSVVAGNFTYTPPIGTQLGQGNHTLSTIFTPADSGNYMTANASVTILVNNPPSGGGSPAPSGGGGGGGGGSTEVKKSKKGGGKSSSAKRSGGSKKSDSKKSSGSNSSSGKKSGGKKAKKK